MPFFCFDLYFLTIVTMNIFICLLVILKKSLGNVYLLFAFYLCKMLFIKPWGVFCVFWIVILSCANTFSLLVRFSSYFILIYLYIGGYGGTTLSYFQGIFWSCAQGSLLMVLREPNVVLGTGPDWTRWVRYQHCFCFSILNLILKQYFLRVLSSFVHLIDSSWAQDLGVSCLCFS